MAPKAFKADDNKVVGVGGKANRTVVNSSKNEKSRNLTRVLNIGATKKPNFLIPDAKKAFNYLRLAFIKAPILQHFDPKSHIWIETDVPGYAIGEVSSQLSLDSHAPSNQWHPVTYFSRKMIPVETRYKTYNAELLAIIKAFKIWRHYLESFKHKVLVLTDQNNLQQFMDIKSLSFRQVWWAQELSRYHFWIDYRQGKANRAANALCRFLQRTLDKEKKLPAKTTQILHCLQFSLMKASLSGLSLGLGSEPDLLPLYQVLICSTHVLPQLRHFWDTFWTELANKSPYTANIGGIRLRLAELQESDVKAQKIRADELKEGLGKYVDVNKVLHN